jgi:hypothetical protein
MYAWGATQSGLMPAANSVGQEQALIDEVVQNEFGNTRVGQTPATTPRYDPNLQAAGEALPDWPTRPGYIKIGPTAIEGGYKRVTITTAHEQMHHTLWARDVPQDEFYAEHVALRFARAKGVISPEEFEQLFEQAKNIYVK